MACIVPPNFDLGGCLDYPLGNNRQERRQFEDYHFLGTRRGYSLDHPPPGNSHLDCPPERSKLDTLDGKDQDRGHGFENHPKCSRMCCCLDAPVETPTLQ